MDGKCKKYQHTNFFKTFTAISNVNSCNFPLLLQIHKPKLMFQFVSLDLFLISFRFALHSKLAVLYLLKVHHKVVAQKFNLTFILKSEDLGVLKPFWKKASWKSLSNSIYGSPVSIVGNNWNFESDFLRSNTEELQNKLKMLFLIGISHFIEKCRRE